MVRQGNSTPVSYPFLCYLFAVVLLLVVVGMGGCSSEEQGISFADPNLEAAIRAAIVKPSGPIYKADLAGLTSFEALGRGIVDLAGLQYATSLTHLYLSDNQIPDISVLASLTGLIELYLGWNQIGDISAVASLTGLTVLNVCSNHISDISALAGLVSLTELYLDGNQISDISPLAGLTSLRELYLYSNQISDISALEHLVSLTTLDLGDNQISDISPLVANAGLGEGDFVALTDNPLSEASLEVYIPQLEGRGVTVLY